MALWGGTVVAFIVRDVFYDRGRRDDVLEECRNTAQKLQVTSAVA